MSTHLHLILVHIPVVGMLFTFTLLVYAHIKKQDILFKICYTFLIICGIFTVLAYFTGPLAYKEQGESLAKKYVENHAIIAKTSFVGVIILAVLSFSALTQYWQEEEPSLLHKYAILITALVMLYLLFWTANLGGNIHHPQVRDSKIFLWPNLND